MNIIDFLNENSGAFSVAFSGLVAAATIVYAILTRSLVKETKKLRKTQTEPNVCAYSQMQSTNYHAFVIENIGMGPAQDVRFIIESDLKIHDEIPVTELEVFKEGIKFIAPGQKVIPFWVFPGVGAKKRFPPISLIIKFKNSSGDTFENTLSVFLERAVRIGDLPEGGADEDMYLKRELVGSIRSLTSAIERLKH